MMKKIDVAHAVTKKRRDAAHAAQRKILPVTLTETLHETMCKQPAMPHKHTSPTLFMAEPISGLTLVNFFKSQQGIVTGLLFSF